MMPHIGQQIIVPEGIFIVSKTDVYGRITYVNKEFTDITGYTAEEAIGKPHNILRHPDMPKAAFAELWATITGGNTWRGFIKNKAKDGRYYWVYASVSPYEIEPGKKGFISIRQGITKFEIEREEENLARLQNVLEFGEIKNEK